MAATEPRTSAPAETTPHNLDAEEALLGAMLLSDRAVDACAEILDPGDFYRESHARIYRAALSLHQLGHPVDVITVTDRLQELEQLDQAGGVARIHELAAIVPDTSRAAHWALIVAREARRRDYITAGERIARLAREHTDPDTIAQQTAEIVAAVRTVEIARPPRIATLDEFASTEEEKAEAAIGDGNSTLLPAGGLLIIGGEGGASKTTLTLDAVAHIASGTPWLGYPVQRPVRVLIIENEGPRPQFREKLRDKRDAWAGAPFRGNVHVWEEPWASFSFARDNDRRQLRDITLQHRIDVVVADPLDSLGVVGAGTPEDVRTFISWLRQCGLHNPREPLAFWLLHHFNKSGRGSIIDRLSGAWGGHPDAILGVELGDAQTTKLTWGKLRHATPPRQRTVILAWDLDTRGFTLLEPDDEQVIEQRRLDARDWILDHIRRLPGDSRTATETAYANHHGRGGRTLARTVIDRLLDHGELALGPGRAANGKYLFLAQEASSPLAIQFAEFGEQTASTPSSPNPNGEHHPPTTRKPASEASSPLADASNGEHGEHFASSFGLDSSPLAALPEGEASGASTASIPTRNDFAPDDDTTTFGADT